MGPPLPPALYCIATPYILNRMRTIRHLLLFAGLLCVGLPAVAQPLGLEDNVTLRRQRIEGLPEIGKPSVRLPAPDVEFQADTLSFRHTDLEYVPGLALPSAEAAPLPRPQWERLYTNHLKLALGRWWSPLVELYIADGINGRNPRVGWGLDARHFSSANGHTENAGFSDTRATVRGRYLLDKHTLYGHLGIRHNTLRFFGDSTAQELADWPDSLRQRFMRMEFQAGIRRNYDREAFNYDIPLRVRVYSDRLDNREVHTSLLPQMGYQFSERVGFGLESEFTYSNLKRVLALDSAQTDGQFFLDLAPYATLQFGKLTGNVGFRVDVFSRSDTSFTRIYPILKANYILTRDSSLTAFVEVGGRTNYNQRYTMVDQNPYLAPWAQVMPSAEKFRLEGGVRGHLGRVDYALRGYFGSVAGQPVFVAPLTSVLFDTDTVAGVDSVSFIKTGQFNIAYEDKFSRFGFALDVNYHWQERVNAGISLSYTGYSLSEPLQNFGIPTFQTSVYGGYRFGEKIWVRARLNLIGGRPLGFDALTVDVPNAGRISEVAYTEGNFFADLNLFAEYKISNRFSLFAEGNNLLGMKYYRWDGYRERGLDFRIGGTISL